MARGPSKQGAGPPGGIDTLTVEAVDRLRVTLKRQGIEFSATAVRAGQLMHAKAYALIQLRAGEPASGIVCVASGNATRRGLGLVRGRERTNVELSYVTTRKGDLRDFLSVWERLLPYARK